MILLDATNETLELVTSSTSGIDVCISYADDNGTTLTAGSQETSITTATTTVVLSAPASSTQRQVKMISWENKGTASNSLTLKKDVGGTEYVLRTATLKPWESAIFTQTQGWQKYAQNWESYTANTTQSTTPISARSFNFMKVWSTTEAAWVLHSLHAATGTPWAFSVWTPWVNGRATDWTTETWCIPVKNPSTWSNYLTSYMATATTASSQMLIDLLRINTWLVVTTTTAQSITFTALPARDLTGTTNWEDVKVWILVTTATTNAGAITNTTCSYTNSAGTAGKTGTISSFPATAAVWTLVPFQLAAWDSGVRSVESVTLGTSYAGGAISLVAYRIIAWVPVLVANAWWQFTVNSGWNIRLWNWVCLIPVYMPTATTATTVTWFINVEEK